jgi:hypothetical protein
MLESLYEQDTRKTVHRGAIYSYRPIFWLDHPLWIVRDVRWTPPRNGGLHQWSELKDAFQGSYVEEDVLARAKVRFVVVVSRDYEAQKPRFKDVIVVPMYTLHQDHKLEFKERVRTNQYPELFYLAPDPTYPQIEEGYVNFRQIQSLRKAFLTEDAKLDIALVPNAIKAMLQRYKEYL